MVPIFFNVNLVQLSVLRQIIIVPQFVIVIHVEVWDILDNYKSNYEGYLSKLCIHWVSQNLVISLFGLDKSKCVHVSSIAY